MDRHGLADKATLMWGKYESTVRTGGTSEQRSFAFTQAVKADDRLAVHDRGVLEKGRREAAARALSGS